MTWRFIHNQAENGTYPFGDTWNEIDVLQWLYTHSDAITWGSGVMNFVVVEDGGDMITTVNPTGVSQQVAATSGPETIDGYWRLIGTMWDLPEYFVPTTATYPWHAPEPGDPPVASDGQQLFPGAHGVYYAWDTSGRLESITEDGGRLVTSFTYAGAEGVPTSGSVTVHTTSGTLTQTFDVTMNSLGYVTAITLTGAIVTPDWDAPWNGQGFDSTAIRQMILPHNTLVTRNADGVIETINQDTDGHLITLTLVGNVATEIAENTVLETGSLSVERSLSYDTINRLIGAA